MSLVASLLLSPLSKILNSINLFAYLFLIVCVCECGHTRAAVRWRSDDKF